MPETSMMLLFFLKGTVNNIASAVLTELDCSEDEELREYVDSLRNNYDKTPPWRNKLYWTQATTTPLLWNSAQTRSWKKSWETATAMMFLRRNCSRLSGNRLPRMSKVRSYTTPLSAFFPTSTLLQYATKFVIIDWQNPTKFGKLWFARRNYEEVLRFIEIYLYLRLRNGGFGNGCFATE